MRHRVKKVWLNRKGDHLTLMLRNLATSLFLYESITTTEAKAKAIKPIVEHLIHRAKAATPANAYRALNAYLLDKNASKKLMQELKPRYQDRSSGYLRITHMGKRVGDAAPVVTISFV